MAPKEGTVTDEEIDGILENITTDHLNDWEKSFIESAYDQWERKRRLSDKQKEILSKIWEKQP